MDRETGSINIGQIKRFIWSKPCYFAPNCTFDDVQAIFSITKRTFHAITYRNAARYNAVKR